jgi:23S rRNA pseudouridine1911/1915/1917 synthase
VASAPVEFRPTRAGERLDSLLCQHLDLSRTQVERLISDRKVRVDDRIILKKGTKLAAGQLVSVAPFERPEEWAVIPQPEMDLRVVGVGQGWVAVEKPSGVAVHPLEPTERDTLLNALIARYPQMQGVGEGALKSGVVHRLDVETSGVLVFATEQETWQRLRRAFTEHRTEKIYRVLVSGRLTGSGREKVCLQVTQHKPARVRVVEPAPGIWRCDLQWQAIETFREATLLEVKLGTGFLHQIRATFSHLGHPVMGDVLYGAPANVLRVMLHSASLKVEDVNVRSADPADFAAIIEHLRQPV